MAESKEHVLINRQYVFNIHEITSIAVPLITKIITDHAITPFSNQSHALAFGYTVYKEIIADMFSCFDSDQLEWIRKIRYSYIYPDYEGFSVKTGLPYVPLHGPETPLGINMSQLLTEVEVNILNFLWVKLTSCIDFSRHVNITATLPDSTLLLLRTRYA